jgi:enolase
MVNILNGGVHADNGLVFQESMIRPVGAKNFKEAVEMAATVFHTLKKLLKSHNYSVSVGDEGGFAPMVGSLHEALSLIEKAIIEAGYEPNKDITIALDAAASEFYDPAAKGYNLAKSGPKKVLTPLQMIDYYMELCEKFPIDSIEDPLDQNDWEHWEIMTEKLGKKIQIVGDDIFCTNPAIIKKAITEKVSNAVLIKPNQIGTLSETLDAIRLAKAHRMGCVMSHRSGETEDTTLADLAVGFGCHQIKTGSVCRSERVAKYNRLLEIEYELGPDCAYQGAKR